MSNEISQSKRSHTAATPSASFGHCTHLTEPPQSGRMKRFSATITFEKTHELNITPCQRHNSKLRGGFGCHYSRTHASYAIGRSDARRLLENAKGTNRHFCKIDPRQAQHTRHVPQDDSTHIPLNQLTCVRPVPLALQKF